MARVEYERIDTELAAQFDYETGHQPVFSSYEELLFALSEKSGWRKLVAARDRYEERIGARTTRVDVAWAHDARRTGFVVISPSRRNTKGSS